jgi:plasmid maintenance system killer protein
MWVMRDQLLVKSGLQLSKQRTTVSLRINDQWRICFVWKDGEVWDVEIVEYH